MKQTWQHPELGEFTYDYPAWTAIRPFPAFREFKFRYSGKHVPLNERELAFQVKEEEDGNTPQHPSKRAVAVALRVIKNQELLADRLIKALWRDLNGRGRNSGMWWHGDLRTEDSTVRRWIAEAFGKRDAKLERPKDLYDVLGGTDILIRESIYRYEKPCATIGFDAAFDEEHGVGVLTDGTRILGTGYSYDVTPYGRD